MSNMYGKWNMPNQKNTAYGHRALCHTIMGYKRLTTVPTNTSQQQYPWTYDTTICNTQCLKNHTQTTLWAQEDERHACKYIYVRIYYNIHTSVHLYYNAHISIRRYTTSYTHQYIYTRIHTPAFEYTHQHNYDTKIPHNLLDIIYN